MTKHILKFKKYLHGAKKVYDICEDEVMVNEIEILPINYKYWKLVILILYLIYKFNFIHYYMCVCKIFWMLVCQT